MYGDGISENEFGNSGKWEKFAAAVYGLMRFSLKSAILYGHHICFCYTSIIMIPETETSWGRREWTKDIKADF